MPVTKRVKQRHLFKRDRVRGEERPGPKPKHGAAGVSHHGRPKLSHAFPVHVTMKLLPRVGTLRRGNLFVAIRRAFDAGKETRLGFRLTHFSVQRDHIHLMVEAGVTIAAVARDVRSPNGVLSRGMQALAIRIAKGINRVLGTRGRVFADRYHMHVLKSPRETRNALAYVLSNAWKHFPRIPRGRPSICADPYSSGAYFDGWRPESRVPRAAATSVPPVVGARTWLLREGWRRGGLLRLGETVRPGWVAGSS